MPTVRTVGYGVPVVGDDGGGGAVICFPRTINNGQSGERSNIWARIWNRGGRLGPALRVSPEKGNVTFYNAVATDRAGNSIVVWSQWASQAQTAVFGRRISRTGSLGRVTRLGMGDQPAATVAGGGGGLVVWQPLLNSAPSPHLSPPTTSTT